DLGKRRGLTRLLAQVIFHAPDVAKLGLSKPLFHLNLIGGPAQGLRVTEMPKPALGVIRSAAGLSHEKLNFSVERRDFQALSELVLGGGKVASFDGIQRLLPMVASHVVPQPAPPAPRIAQTN